MTEVDDGVILDMTVMDNDSLICMLPFHEKKMCRYLHKMLLRLTVQIVNIFALRENRGMIYIPRVSLLRLYVHYTIGCNTTMQLPYHVIPSNAMQMDLISLF